MLIHTAVGVQVGGWSVDTTTAQVKRATTVAKNKLVEAGPDPLVPGASLPDRADGAAL